MLCKYIISSKLNDLTVLISGLLKCLIFRVSINSVTALPHKLINIPNRVCTNLNCHSERSEESAISYSAPWRSVGSLQAE
ncbi:MAG: CxxxxCH/CxxCH domain-containing protein [Bacteroidales bacterium]|nr:CxxxxCH/CxxCH domain-containing protein [Bacteroidales bacterium]MBQ6184340.1 CxxxxCH/CxxCH domain-containing protein [Bacteroidales bacterium]MBR0299813.1 CxxxxCH/CxxCH domain-containing protein [Bacteroidales bacterium]